MKSGEKRAEDQFLLAAQERPSLVSGAGTNGSTSKNKAPDEMRKSISVGRSTQLGLPAALSQSGRAHRSKTRERGTAPAKGTVWNLQDMFRDARARALFHEKNQNGGICFASKNTGAVPALEIGFTFVLVAGDQNHTTSAVGCTQKSMHSCQPELRALDGVNDARRGAALACRLSGADQR